MVRPSEACMYECTDLTVLHVCNRSGEVEVFPIGQQTVVHS